MSENMIKVVRDICERPFPIDYTPPGPWNITGFGTTKEWNTRKLFPHLCESCAGKIDLVIAKFKDEVAVEALINERNRKINEERKKRLGTKG
jgi:hypothetical protein